MARAANEAATILLRNERKPAEEGLRVLATQYARTLAMSPEAIGAATLAARQTLVNMAQVLELRVEKGTPAARLLVLPTSPDAPPDIQDMLSTHELRADETHTLPVMLQTQAGMAPSPTEVAEVLSAGIQDITNAMVENFKLNDILRIILETMFRALGARRMVFCLRDAKTDIMTGRFGLGEGSEEAVRAMAVPLKVPGDLFAAVCLRGADTLINDATEPRMQERLPDWYQKNLNAPTFLLLPLQIKGRPFALIYADQSRAGGLPWMTRPWGCCAPCATRQSWRSARPVDGQAGGQGRGARPIIAPWEPLLKSLRSSSASCPCSGGSMAGWSGLCCCWPVWGWWRCIRRALTMARAFLTMAATC